MRFVAPTGELTVRANGCVEHSGILYHFEVSSVDLSGVNRQDFELHPISALDL